MSNVSTCTVIIPTYNRAELVGYTLAALTRQRLPRDRFEVIVVDDGSSDRTAEVVSDFRGRLNIRYFYQNDEGFRAAAARNVAIGHAKGDVCVFLDSGVMASSGCLTAHMASHDEADSSRAVCGLLYGMQPMFDVSEQMRALLDLTDIDRTIERMRNDSRLVDIREHFYARYTDQLDDLPAPWQVYWTGNASAPTSLVREVGAFDEAFRCWGGEDIDLGYRLHCARVRFVVNRSASAVHFPHPKDAVRDVNTARENYRYMRRKYGTEAIRLLAELPDWAFVELNDVLRGRVAFPTPVDCSRDGTGEESCG